METKVCSRCKKELPIGQFKPRKNGWAYYCNDCAKEAGAKFRAKHPGNHLKYYKPTPILIKTCVHCGKEFETKNPLHKSCSRNCKIPRELKKNLTYSAEHLGKGKCNKCGKELPINQFSQRKYRDGSLGYYNQCKDCRKVLMDNWHDAHKRPTIIKTCERCGKEYIAKNINQKYCAAYCGDKVKKHINDLKSMTPEQLREHKKQYIKQWHNEHKDQVKQWHIDNKDRLTALRKKHKAANLVEYRAKAQSRKKKRMSNDIDYKLKTRLSNIIRSSINGNKQYKHSIDLLGCSVIDARKHIERQFKDGMTWDNWGVFGWHLDHIIPIASFNFTDYEQQKRCFHYTNLQPLWWLDNVKKGDKIIEKQLCLI